jgi:endonuclease/exonuclease/phosphatase family metal-dependent hydrolase
MFARLRPYLVILEAGLLGLFFVQALRYLIGALYSRVASAALVLAYPAGSYDTSLPGIVDPNIVSSEIIMLGTVFALPLLALVLGRLRFMPLIAAALVIIGRAAISFPIAGLTQAMGAEIAVGAGLLYIGVVVAQRAKDLPYFFILGFAFDQVIRAFGDTLDPSIWRSVNTFNIDFFTILIVLLALAGLLSLINVLLKAGVSREQQQDGSQIDTNRGLLGFWGAIGMGGLLFIELSLLALPNALMGRAGTELYQLFVTLTLLATLLPLVPELRSQARNLIAPFDPTTRGWIWLILIALLIVVGTRIQRLPLPNASLFPFGGIALVLAQVAVSMMWWWLARPKAENERNFGGLWLVFTALIFGVFVVMENFTYEYSFVRPFLIAGNEGLTNLLNQIVWPMLRGFRGLGLGVLLLALLLGVLPMIQATRRIPWRGGSLSQSFLSLLFVAAITALGSFASRPPSIAGLSNLATMRIGTLNIHSGYSEFYAFDLETLAQDISGSGVAVLLLQQVEVGRLSSFGVDESLWLARRLRMDKRFYATNEGIFGLAVLSRLEIRFNDGVLLPSVDRQTGLQRVQIQPSAELNSVITLYNTELGFLLQGEDIEVQEANQENQILAIIGTFEQHRQNGQVGRALLGGTFNNVPSHPVLNHLRDYGFTDPFAGANITLSYTLNRTNYELARLDYLWIWEQSLPELGTGVIPTVASDHRGAWVEFEIRAGN